MTAGKITEACAAFDQSQRFEAGLMTQLDLADCRENNNQVATAWALLVDVEHQTQTSGDAVTQQLHDVAQNRAMKLEPHVSKLTISVPTDSQLDGLEIFRDGQPLGAAMWNRALPIDGGTYTITARRPNTSTWSMRVSVRTVDDVKTVEVPTLPMVVSPEPRRATTAAVQSAPDRSWLVLPASLAVDAVVLGGVALAFELTSESTYNQAKAETSNLNVQNADANSANLQRHVGQGFAIGGALAASAAVWLYARGRRADDRRATVVATPVGLAVVGGF